MKHDIAKKTEKETYDPHSK